MSVKKFTINCDYGGQLSPTTIYIGTPKEGNSAVYFQQDWLSKEKGGRIPSNILNLLTELQEISQRNGVCLAELCAYALITANHDIPGGQLEDNNHD